MSIAMYRKRRQVCSSGRSWSLAGPKLRPRTDWLAYSDIRRTNIWYMSSEGSCMCDSPVLHQQGRTRLDQAVQVVSRASRATDKRMSPERATRDQELIWDQDRRLEHLETGITSHSSSTMNAQKAHIRSIYMMLRHGDIKQCSYVHNYRPL